MFEALALASRPSLPSDTSPAKLDEMLAKRNAFRDKHKKMFLPGVDNIEKREANALKSAPRRGPSVKRVVKKPAPRKSATPAASKPVASGRTSTKPGGSGRRSRAPPKKILSSELVDVSSGEYSVPFFWFLALSGTK